MIKKKILRDTALLTLIQLALDSAALLLNVFITRRLGASAIGIFSLMGSFLGLAGILSNGNAFLCTSRLVSEELGAVKPSAEFFARSVGQLPGFSKERALLVGDSLTSDIRGARNAGIRSCWFNFRAEAPREDIPADFEIRSLAELPPLLSRLFPET